MSKIGNKAKIQSEWYSKFETLLILRHPELSGRIDWNAAKYYFLYGTPIIEAVDQYCIARGLSK